MLITKEHSISSVKPCSLNCANKGYCVSNPVTSSGQNLLDGKLREVCICPEGYTGLSCQKKTRSMDTCIQYGDSRICLNGNHCAKVMTEHNLHNSILDHANDGSEWFCDCAEADGVSAFAGDMCRKPHTEYCNKEGTTYCTNGGSCVNSFISHSLSLQYEG